jgi:bifunctional N-acetylglucosamine-1-phosphate-uridyltransferase/glucosamine-1-phosphate-acetyltransferase GlmU-like protein
MELSLVIMAAGLGSRFGGTKQLVEVGPNSEAFLDFAIKDGRAAGCDQVVLIIRSDIEDDVRGHLRRQYGSLDGFVLVRQDDFGPQRDKPWGTAHAVLSAAAVVPGSFIVVNADDYYGPKSFQLAADALRDGDDRTAALVAFELAKTLPDEGSVSRGVCAVSDGELESITETHGISRHADGQIRSEDPEGEHGDDAKVSMNMFAFPQLLFPHLVEQWDAFYDEFGAEAKTEYLLPDVVDRLRKAGELTVIVPSSSEEWIGVTNPNDLGPAREKLVHRV